VILQFQKGLRLQLSPHFNLLEFHCRCVYPDCQTTAISEYLIEGLELVRKAVGPIEITNGFRCAKHNADIGGSPKSQHLLGQAADCRPLRATRYALQRAAKRVPHFSQGGVGLYSWGVHLDVRGTPARWIA
jgi:zinc D-Ala-D-Ala carboxypeptidase